MKITAEPRSDQWNAEDFLGGPRTFTVAGVKVGTAEQKYDIALEGEQRVWRPPLTVLRILIKCWGDEAAAWTGKRVTLYCDERVTFGRDAVGGIRVSHVSHIDKPLTLNLTATRGKRQKVTVQPLPDAPAPAADKTTGEVIPEDVLANVARAKADGNLPAYLDHLIEREAPSFILEYVKNQVAK